MNKVKRYEILKRFEHNNPYPTIELIYSSVFELLIAVLLSARTTDVSVNKVTHNLFLLANTPQTLLTLGVDNIRSCIKKIGLFNNKAKNIIQICKILINQYNGKIPENRIALEKLPGVGRKTANVVLNNAFGWSTIAVDSHVFRVCNRTNFAVGKNVKIVEEKLLKIVPISFKYRCHNWLVLHGRYVCKAYKPYCNTCSIKDLCEFKQKCYVR